MKPPYRATKNYTNCFGRMTKIAAMSIKGKILVKSSDSEQRDSVAFGNAVHINCVLMIIVG